jgi:hypothetical protein
MGTSTIRSLVCISLALSLCAPMLATAAPGAELHRAAEFRAVTAVSSTALLTRAGGRHDHARQRSCAPSLSTLVPLHGSLPNSGRLAAVIEHPVPALLWTAGPWTGRSPPAIS